MFFFSDKCVKLILVDLEPHEHYNPVSLFETSAIVLEDTSPLRNVVSMHSTPSTTTVDSLDPLLFNPLVDEVRVGRRWDLPYFDTFLLAYIGELCICSWERFTSWATLSNLHGIMNTTNLRHTGRNTVPSAPSKTNFDID
jgi:hypothetical protein